MSMKFEGINVKEVGSGFRDLMSIELWAKSENGGDILSECIEVFFFLKSKVSNLKI